MKINPFRKRRKLPTPLRAKTQYKNPFFSKENFSDVLFRILKIHYGLILLIIFGSGYLFFFSEIFQINFIEVIGASKISNDEVKLIVTEKIDKSRFVFFNQKNYFMLDRKDVEEEVRSAIQSTIGLEEFSLKKKFPRTIKVTLREIVPSITWFNGRRYYYIDKSGLVAQSVNEDEVDKSYSLIEDVNQFSLSPPEQIISPETLASLPEITSRLSEIGIEVVSLQTPEVECPEEVQTEVQDLEINNENSNLNQNTNSTLENNNTNVNNINIEDCDRKDLLLNSRRINVKTTGEYLIYFDTSQNIEEQVYSLDLILKNTLKGKTERLQYIDLRFENRVYYK